MLSAFFQNQIKKSFTVLPRFQLLFVNLLLIIWKLKHFTQLKHQRSILYVSWSKHVDLCHDLFETFLVFLFTIFLLFVFESILLMQKRRSNSLLVLSFFLRSFCCRGFVLTLSHQRPSKTEQNRFDKIVATCKNQRKIELIRFSLNSIFSTYKGIVQAFCPWNLEL